jgi:hypothetical protein
LRYVSRTPELSVISSNRGGPATSSSLFEGVTSSFFEEHAPEPSKRPIRSPARSGPRHRHLGEWSFISESSYDEGFAAAKKELTDRTH